MRMLSVSSDVESIQQECGSSWVPIAPRNALTSFIRAFEPSAAPAIRSEWPPTYLVSEYSEISAPCSIGRWKTGPSSVLSHAMIGTWSCASPMLSAIRRIIAISTRPLVGLAGVSMRIIDTRPLRIASSAAELDRGFVDAIGKAHRADRESLQASSQAAFPCRHRAAASAG